MRIALVTPAAKQSKSGNRTTAVRYARILRDLGHRVKIVTASDGKAVEMMVAIHAWRSSDAIEAFRKQNPSHPLIVVLSGTDIYRFQRDEPERTLRSMSQADRLVGLHDEAANDIPPEFHAKLRIIHQSAVALAMKAGAGPRSKRTFDICVVGHLREEKDPLRAARAATTLPSSSRVRIIHLGKAYDPRWRHAALAEMGRNPRYLWRGEVSKAQVRRCFARSELMVISSIMEGGANVVSEAIVAGLPVIASDIPGNRGLLGAAHPAYFPIRDEAALAALLLRAENEPEFLDAIRAAGRLRAPLFDPRREHGAWSDLLGELTSAR